MIRRQLCVTASKGHLFKLLQMSYNRSWQDPTWRGSSGLLWSHIFWQDQEQNFRFSLLERETFPTSNLSFGWTRDFLIVMRGLIARDIVLHNPADIFWNAFHIRDDNHAFTSPSQNCSLLRIWVCSFLILYWFNFVNKLSNWGSHIWRGPVWCDSLQLSYPLPLW